MLFAYPIPFCVPELPGIYALLCAGEPSNHTVQPAQSSFSKYLLYPLLTKIHLSRHYNPAFPRNT